MTRQPGDKPSRFEKFSLGVPSSIRGLHAGLRWPRARRRITESIQTTQETGADLHDRLAPEGRLVLDIAQDEARALGHRRVGTEHLLLALTGNAGSGACRVLEQLGTTPLRVRTDVLNSIVTGAAPTSGPLALTPRARLAVELGHRASARIGVALTETEHLLIGLAAEGEGIAAKALHKSGIMARTAEHQVTADLDGRRPAP